MHALVPDSRGLEWDFHDVTIVDMGDLPESSVSMDELSLLRRQWPPTVIPGRGSAPTVTNRLNVTCIIIWLCITWT